MSTSYKRRPCRICRKWFLPKRRGGKNQKTCLDSSCRLEWKRRKSREWHRANPDYLLDRRACARHEQLQDALENPKSPHPSPVGPTRYPRELGKAVMGVEGAAFIEVTLELLLGVVKAVISKQVPRNKLDTS